MSRLGDRRSFIRQIATSLLGASMWPTAGVLGSSTEAVDKEWRHYGGDAGGMRYSPLDHINRSNVHDLNLAWTYHTGDARRRPATTMECTPVVVDGVMYFTSPQLKICAVNAASGNQLWKFDPFETLFGGQRGHPRGVNRGVTFWQDDQNREDKRILSTALSSLICLNAKTGKLVPSFGDGGSVDLTKGLGRDITGLEYDVTSPGVVYKDLIIMGSEVGEGPDPAAPGHVRAFDIRTGKQTWIFHTIPQPGELGHDTWEGDAWKTAGGVNDWGGMTVDVERGWVFLATGSASFDFYGGQRLGQTLFANCVIALDASTGKRIWHYQVVHHDLWDRDLPAPPSLVRVKRNGRMVDAVAQTTKFGQIFLLDRETGAPLFPVEERPIPASDMPGEKSWPTEPTSSLAYTRQVFTDDEVTNISPEAHDYVLNIVKQYRRGNLWQPPSLQGTIEFPATNGGTDWGGGSFDPSTGWIYVNSQNEVGVFKLTPAPPGSGHPYNLAPPTYERIVDQEGYPAIKPPWGELAAIDLNEGKIVWRVILGEFKELTARGIPQTGTVNMGGSVVTRGGLVFVAATKDEKFRAFDKETGKVLWEADLPAGGYASPCTYEVNGKQYVAIAAGGGGKQRTPSGDAIVVFALP